MMKTKRAALGFLQLTQSEVTEAQEFASAYDLSIAAVSWESRCGASALFLKASGAPATLLRFSSSAKDIAKRKEDQYALIANTLGPSHTVLELGQSLDFESNFQRIEALIRDVYAKAQRPLRILLDASCIPKRYLLCLLGFGFKREFICAFDVIYAEGSYDIPSSPKLPRVPTPRGLVSEGEWTSVQVPYLESSDFAPRQRDLCISTGAEISVAIPLIDRMDARRIQLIEIAGSDKRVTMAAHEQAALSKIKSEPNVQTVSFELHDVIGLAKHILSCREIAMTCMAIGSKSHAIALAIAGLSDDLIEIVCRAPGGYVAGEVKPTGRLFRYLIEDRFEPQSYLNIRPAVATVATKVPAKTTKRKSKRS